MRSYILIGALVVGLLAPMGCTNMTKTQQGALSGGAVGAAAGAGIAAIAGGGWATGAAIGGALGAVAGGIYGHNQQQK